MVGFLTDRLSDFLQIHCDLRKADTALHKAYHRVPVANLARAAGASMSLNSATLVDVIERLRQIQQEVGMDAPFQLRVLLEMLLVELATMQSSSETSSDLRSERPTEE